MLLTQIITHESDNDYHSRSKSGEMLSSHMLARFAKSPWKYYQTITGQHTDEDKAEFAFGRAAHCLILEDMHAFNERYIVSDGPVNERTGAPYGKTTKAYLDWKASQVGDVIAVADFDDMVKMNESCKTHEGIMELLSRDYPLRFAEGVVRAVLDGVTCQIKMDYFAPEVGIVDLKTCRDIEFFEKDCRDFGYAYQLAFYQAVLEIATGTKYPVHIIAVDKTDFHIAGRWDIPDSELEICQSVNRAAIKRMKECRDTHEWPTGYERTRIFALDKEAHR